MDRVTRTVINKSQRKISALKDLTGQDRSQKFIIPLLLDELDGAKFQGNTLTTSGTPTVDELEACVGALANRLNLLIRALKEENIIR